MSILGNLLMKQSIKIAPPNSLIGISDAQRGMVPDSMPETGIAATESCILVACMPDVDGETEIVFGHASEVDPGSPPAFDHQLSTPTGSIQVVTTEWKPLLTLPVESKITRLRVWPNRRKLPDRLVIGVG
jgi:hypothetical protein